jgi:glutamyl-tRNA synthetase
MSVTHIIRGKEHLTNQIRQEFMYHYLGWKYPEAIHYGRLKITGASLSKSKIVQGVRDGTFQSWDDPRLATFAALRRRGIQADAIKQLILDVGPKTQDVTLSWKNLYAHNRKIIEPQANRYFFVHAPKLVSIHNIPNPVSAEIPLHPDHSERGVRQFNINPKDGVAKFWVATNDVKEMKKGKVIRFMELFNITVDTLNAQGVTASFHSQQYEKAKKLDAPLIHWLPDATRLKCQVVLPDASNAEGFVEAYCKEVPADTIVQFERFGFVRIDSINDRLITAYYCHR